MVPSFSPAILSCMIVNLEKEEFNPAVVSWSGTMKWEVRQESQEWTSGRWLCMNEAGYEAQWRCHEEKDSLKVVDQWTVGRSGGKRMAGGELKGGTS